MTVQRFGLGSMILTAFFFNGGCARQEGDVRQDAAADKKVASDRKAAAARQDFTYPPTSKVAEVDDYNGVKVEDPYRWLEDLDSTQTRDWINAQNQVTFGFLESIPQRPAIIRRMTELWNFERFGTPIKRGGRYFMTRNDGLQNQDVLYVMDGPQAEMRVLLDPNTLSTEGTTALKGYEVSHDGRLMAYQLSEAGSDWETIRVRDIQSGQDLEDVVKWVKFSGLSWTRDGWGFYYSRYDEPQGDKLEEKNYFHKLYFHRIGTPQSADMLIYHRPDEKEWGFEGSVTDDGRYLVISVWQGTERKNRIYVKDLARNNEPIRLLDRFDAQYGFVDNEGTTFWFFTDRGAPKGRLVAMDLDRPEEFTREIIPESEQTLEGVNLIADRFVASYLKDAQTLVRVFDLDGNHLHDADLPGIGTAAGFDGRRTDNETFYSFTGFSTPSAIYRYDPAAGLSELYKKPTVSFNPDDYETRQVFYNSKDGTRVPMFISHKKGLRLDGNNPTLLYGYGGFNIPLTPRFKVGNLVWMEMGGVYAMPNLRGGGEYGKVWHDAGRLHNKQNVFDDFVAAAEWLIANKYTSRDKLAIHGGSNGGLLVGACMTQRPDLFAAALPAVGVMDMLRFNKFTIGWAWQSDYGSPENPEDFKILHSYSPLHNLRPGTRYPSTLITTADHDDRVVPSHSFKFAAALQQAHKGDNPVMIRIETQAGHGAGKPTTKQIEEAADMWAFLVRTLDMRIDGPAGEYYAARE